MKIQESDDGRDRMWTQHVLIGSSTSNCPAPRRGVWNSVREPSPRYRYRHRCLASEKTEKDRIRSAASQALLWPPEIRSPRRPVLLLNPFPVLLLSDLPRPATQGLAKKRRVRVRSAIGSKAVFAAHKLPHANNFDQQPKVMKHIIGRPSSWHRSHQPQCLGREHAVAQTTITARQPAMVQQ